MADPAGRVAIITGGSVGIGAATARAFAGAGMRLALCARRRDRLERFAAELHGAGAEVSTFALDVTDERAVRAMVDEVAARCGGVDVLVNNAGRGLAARFEDTTPAEFRELLELNLLATIVASQAALPHMRTSRDAGTSSTSRLWSAGAACPAAPPMPPPSSRWAGSARPSAWSCAARAST